MKRISLVAVFVALFMMKIGPAQAEDWRLPVGLAYISGFGEITDHYEDNLRARGFQTEGTDGIPFGISFQPYYETRTGMGFGIGLGPVMAIGGDVDFFNLPVNLNVRYTILPESSTAFYIKGGISTNMASGDFVEDAQIGFLGAIGIEFLRTKAVGVGIELGYDSSTIELIDRTTYRFAETTKEFEPTGVFLSVSAVF